MSQIIDADTHIAEPPWMVQTLRSREDLCRELVDKILTDNPKRFYSL